MREEKRLRGEMLGVLREKIIPFWLQRSVDAQYGGYLTCFDENGDPSGETDKFIVTQARMLWGFSYLSDFCAERDKPALLAAAKQGFAFMLEHFWDRRHGGFVWRTDRAGAVLDAGKVVYGQSFGLYAFAQYFRSSGDEAALAYAQRTFELLQIYAADTLNGGYYENLEQDWSRSPGGVFAGDRKSLDIHMHLMEAFDTLYAASGREIHARKLREVIDVILRHMVNRESGYGCNQFDARFAKIPAINIHRTWNAEREAGERIDEPADTTSYGHNVELSWLASQALELLNIQDEGYDGVLQKLLDHALAHGYDYEYGGVYRDGVADGEVLVTDKEWWQNFEAMVGYSNGYLRYGDVRYLDALERTWRFVREKFLHPRLGESRQLLDRTGAPIVGDLGNPWKGIYHTGRALAETALRLERVLEKR